DYTYLNSADQDGTDTISYRYLNKKLESSLPFIVQSAINLEVSDVKTDNINAGGSGNITLTLKNTGKDPGKNAIAYLNGSMESPIVPVSNGVYIGNFAPGSTATVTYKVSVSEDAHPQEYPIMVGVVYDNTDGKTLLSPFKRVGVLVGSKVHFTITSAAPKINPGNKNPVEVTYKNDGSVTVYSAEARISAVDPFSSSDDLAYLGDLKPGESAKARFGLTLSSNADTKVYGLDSEVKYRDSLDDSHVSDTVKVPIDVVKLEGPLALLSNPVVIGVLLILILGGAYSIREKQQQGKLK
ncbi:MAG: S-layer protein, partial [Methanospirillum sp.]|uniref:COG1361 S-layer family protein n=1 Tax=Methanospirillum sp. TaxID=45200 RepID=UPI00237166B1|nr:S-layer protein [Methanospirillum sp.]